MNVMNGSPLTGIAPDPCRRLAFPITRGVDDLTLMTGCCVAMQETGVDGLFFRDGVLTKTIVAASVRVEISVTGKDGGEV